MKKTTLFLFIFLILLTVRVNAQEKIIYDQYHFNYYLINPAIAGADKCSHLMLTTKNNWIGQDGPATQALTFRTRLTDSNVGLGGYIFNDRTPNFGEIGGQATFAYHIPMSKGARYLRNVLLDRQLSFGVSIKANQASYDATGNPNDPADVSFSEFRVNANVGVYYESYGFFTGLSGTNLIPYESDHLGTIEPTAPITGFFFIGNTFHFNEASSLEPSFNLTYNEYANKQIDLNLKYTQNNAMDDFGWWAQLSYRHNFDEDLGKPSSIIPIVGLRVKKWQFAYATNIFFNEMTIGNDNYGTHEIMLAYTFCVPKRFCR